MDFKLHRNYTFIALYIAYGSVYFLRMPLSIIKKDLIKVYDISPSSLGYLDLAFLLPYALASLSLGRVIQYYGPRLVLTSCLMLAGVSVGILPFCTQFFTFLLFISFGGVFQALCWPSAIVVISKAFEQSKSSVIGLFGTCCFVGGIIGKCLAIYIKYNYAWNYIFIVPAVFVIVNSISVVVFTEKDKAISLNENFNSLSFWEILKLSGVALVSCCMFFIKMVRYSFLFWLPLFFDKYLHYPEDIAGYASLSFDFGGIFGSYFIGYLSDRIMSSRDMLTCSLCLVGSEFSLLFFCFLPESYWVGHFSLLLFSGGLIGGCDVLLTGSVAAKLGERYGSGSVHVSSLTGIINGVGSLGTVLEGPVIAYVSTWLGWSAVLPTIILFIFIATLLAFWSHWTLSSLPVPLKEDISWQ